MTQRDYYDNNKDLFILIYMLGNKVAFQNQIRNLCLKLNLYKYKQQFNTLISDLVDVELIERREGIYETKTDLILLRNPAIKWIVSDLKDSTGRNYSKEKPTVNKSRVDMSLFKIQYAINFLDNNPSIQNTKDLLVELEKDSNILYTRKKGLEYLDSFIAHNKEVIYIYKKEYKELREELEGISVRQKESIPSRKGKGKDYSEKVKKDLREGKKVSKSKSKKKADLGADKNSKKSKKIEYLNNFNSFLERECLLKLGRVEKSMDAKNKMYNLDVYFTLYVLDIRGTLTAKQIAEKSQKTYLMLKKFLCDIKPKTRDFNMCKTCPKNINNKNYVRIKRSSATYLPDNVTDFERIQSYYYTCNPSDKENKDYKGCTDNVMFINRIIHLDVKVLTWSECRKTHIHTDCYTVSEEQQIKKNPLNNLDLYLIDNYEITEAIRTKNFTFEIVDYGLERDVLGGNAKDNITKQNKKTKAKREVKDNIYEMASNGALTEETAQKLIDALTQNALNSIK